MYKDAYLAPTHKALLTTLPSMNWLRSCEFMACKLVLRTFEANCVPPMSTLWHKCLNKNVPLFSDYYFGNKFPPKHKSVLQSLKQGSLGWGNTGLRVYLKTQQLYVKDVFFTKLLPCLWFGFPHGAVTVVVKIMFSSSTPTYISLQGKYSSSSRDGYDC